MYEFNQVEEDIEALNARYRNVEPGDRYVLSWDGEQLRLALNDEVLFEGGDADAASAMFGIWLGETPLGENFRDELLARQ